MPSSKLFFLILVLVLLGLFATAKWLRISLIGLAGITAVLAIFGLLG